MDKPTTLTNLDVNLSLIDRLRGLLSLLVAYTILRCFNLEKISKIVSKLKNRCSREITTNEADIVWAAVRKFGFILLGRAACIELSLAFVFFAATKGLSATWCVGVSNDPIKAHSWIEIDGKAFRETENFEQHFRALIAI